MADELIKLNSVIINNNAKIRLFYLNRDNIISIRYSRDKDYIYRFINNEQKEIFIIPNNNISNNYIIIDSIIYKINPANTRFEPFYNYNLYNKNLIEEELKKEFALKIMLNSSTDNIHILNIFSNKYQLVPRFGTSFSIDNLKKFFIEHKFQYKTVVNNTIQWNTIPLSHILIEPVVNNIFQFYVPMPDRTLIAMETTVAAPYLQFFIVEGPRVMRVFKKDRFEVEHILDPELQDISSIMIQQ